MVAVRFSVLLVFIRIERLGQRVIRKARNGFGVKTALLEADRMARVHPITLTLAMSLHWPTCSSLRR